MYLKIKEKLPSSKVKHSRKIKAINILRRQLWKGPTSMKCLKLLQRWY